MQDLNIHPTYVVKNYNIDTGEFEVWYNDGTLVNDEWYGPLNMDLDTMRPESEEPLHFQIASRVVSQVQRKKLEECDMEASKIVLAQMMGVEQEIDVMSMVKHQETMNRKESPSTDPICQSTQIMNIYSEDDFDDSEKGACCDWRSFVVRVLLSTTCFFVAVYLPYFANVVAFVGAFCSCFVSLVFPCAAYLKMFWKNLGLFEIVLNSFLVVLGLILCVWGTLAVFVSRPSD